PGGVATHPASSRTKPAKNARMLRKRRASIAIMAAPDPRARETLARPRPTQYKPFVEAQVHQEARPGGGGRMFGLIQDRPLLISSLIQHADRHHGATEIVSRSGDGTLHRYTIRDAHGRAKRLAGALARLGIAQGERVATLAWNNHRHFEFYYAVS